MNKQMRMDSDLQWIVIQLLLCSCCIVFVNLEEFGELYTIFDDLRNDANKVFNYFGMSVSSFNELYRRLNESLQRRNSKMRNCIQPV
jgi:hypothetical protein